MIFASPLITTVQKAQDWENGFGLQFYDSIKELVKNQGLELSRRTTCSYQSRQIGFSVWPYGLDKDGTKRFPDADLVIRFCETMQVWAVNGYMSFYDVVIEESGTLQKYGIRFWDREAEGYFS